MPVSPRGIAFTLFCALSPLLLAEEVTLSAVADTSLFGNDPDYNFGRQRDLPSGGLGAQARTSRLCRVLYKFDIAASIPAGAAIEAAEMKLSISRQIPDNARTSDFVLNRVLVDWGEGMGFGERPGGREAIEGEATWNRRFHPDEAWSAPGGQFGVDFAAEQSALIEKVHGSKLRATTYSFALDPTGVADLQSMLDEPASNFGWVLTSAAETTRLTARRWVSRETINEGPAPELRITYSVGLAAPKLSAVTRDPGSGDLLVTLSGLAGHRYELQAGSDLVSWSEIASQNPEDDGEIEFRMPVAETTQFVRVVVSRAP